MVIYGCGMPDTVVMYMAAIPSVTYRGDSTVSKITPEDLIKNSTVTVTDLDSLNVTPVYSAPGKD
jgi:hypothetical protein